MILFLAIMCLSKYDFVSISGSEAIEKCLFKIIYGSMPYGGMFSCCYFPLPFEFPLAMGISIRVTYYHFFSMKIFS